MSKQIQIRTSLIWVVLLSTVAFSQTFSPDNRYELSSSLLLAQRHSMTDTAPLLPFFSSGSGFAKAADRCTSFTFTADSQRVAVDLGAAAGFEYYRKASRFGVLSGDVSYTSGLLDAYITMDMYSTERRDISPIADVQFERYIKTDFNKPIEGMFDFRANLPEAYLQTKYKSLTLATGKKKIRWGPGYKGTLGLSGTAYSPFYYYDVNLLFGSLFHVEAFLCGYDDESHYRHEIVMSEKIVVSSNKTSLQTFLPRYGAGQRLDIRLGEHVQLGIFELADFFGSNELNRFTNPLQLYYLSNEASGTNNSNLIGGMDLNLIFKPLRLYAEFVNDDITVFEQTGNPDKYGLQAGAAFYGAGRLVVAGIEYTHLTRYLYGHSRVLSRHAHWGESMGWPWGNNQDVVSSYAAANLPHNINARVELNYWLKGNAAIENDWNADGKPDLDNVPYLPEHAEKIYSAILSAEYAPRSWLSGHVYVEPVVQHKKFTSGVYAYLQVKLPGR